MDNITSKKPLIALLTNNDDDVYCFRKELIEGLIENGYKVLISCPDGPKFQLLSHLDYIYDNPNIDRRGTNVIADYKLYRHYVKLFKKYRPTAVLTYTAKPNVYAGMASKKLKIPYVVNVTGLGSVINKKGLIKKIIMSLFKKSYRNASCVMFQNSTNMQTAIANKMVKGRYKLLPGSGVNVIRYPLQEYPSGGNGIVGDTVRFNYIGRILKDKGVDDYIEVAKRIKQKYSAVEFNMIGFIEPTEIHYENDLRLLQSQGIINYHGSQNDVKPFIARSHATIHPSIYGEGMSNVLLESASSGRPLITTDNAGCKETVSDGETGYIYQGGNTIELYDFIEKFLAMPNDKRREMGEKGREKVAKEFSREVVVKAYLEELAIIQNGEKR